MFNEQEARDSCCALLKALKHIHFHGVAHRDLKPENILLDSKSDCTSIKLADFGFACVVRDERSNDVCGTPWYMAPEVVRGRLHDTVSVRRVKMFSKGIGARSRRSLLLSKNRSPDRGEGGEGDNTSGSVLFSTS